MNRTKHYVVVIGPGDALICFSMDSARPDSYMDKVENELKRKNYCGEILFDLLAANGESKRRFAKLNFDGDKLHWLQAKPITITSLARDMLNFCQHFYATHPAALSNSVLSADAQQRIRAEVYADSVH